MEATFSLNVNNVFVGPYSSYKKEGLVREVLPFLMFLSTYQKVVGSIHAGDTINMRTKHGLLEGEWIDPW
jgi:hypothetical protein